MTGNRDFAVPYAGRAVSDRNGESAGAAAGRNGVSGEEFLSCGYRNAGTPVGEAPKRRTTGGPVGERGGVPGIRFPTDGHGNVRAARIRGRHGGMKPVGMGDGPENVSSEIQECIIRNLKMYHQKFENIWKH